MDKVRVVSTVFTYLVMENHLQASTYGSHGNGPAPTDHAGSGRRRQPPPQSAEPSDGSCDSVLRGLAQAGTHRQRTENDRLPARARSLVAPPSTARDNASPSSPAKKARKERCANWLTQEVLALVHAKRQLHHEESTAIDQRDLMNSDASKWIHISIVVNRSGFCPCPRDGPACKTKWNQILPEYKRIADFVRRTGVSMSDYWCMSQDGRKSEGLPKQFSEEVFHGIHEWYGRQPTMNPPHTRDLLSTEDSNYTTPTFTGHDDPLAEEADTAEEDPMDMTDDPVDSEDTNGYAWTLPPHPTQRPSAPAQAAEVRNVGPNAPPRSNIPSAVEPVVISSSDSLEFNTRRKTGNTGVRRKHISGHNLIAEATRASGEVMASEMRKMALASRDIERSKIEAQFKVFSEQMEYQRNRDRRLLENAKVVNENAKLSIEKQGEVVMCLSKMSDVISLGMRLQREHCPTGHTERIITGNSIQSAGPFPGQGNDVEKPPA